MKQLSILISIAALVIQGHCAPQLITFNDGKLGVNFGGYHAAVGLGGLLGQNGGSGGLFAEAGTPHGQSARAGLGGSMDDAGGTAGGLYAGATAGGGVKASAGLAGGVTGEKTAGSGYAFAQAGPHYAASGLGGDTSAVAANGFKFAGTKSFGITKGVVDSTVVEPQPEHKKVHKEFKFDAANNVDFVPLAEGKTSVEIEKEVQPAVVFKEVYVQSPPQVIEKVHVHKHPKHHHIHKTAYIGGFVGGEGAIPEVQPAIQKRIDTGLEATASVSGEAGINGNAGEVYTKRVTYQRNPNFFADIFNIPISTLRAVGNFLGNTAGSTSVTVQKSGSVQAEKDLITPKHDGVSTVSESQAHVSIETPKVSKVIDDILAIPINTLGAVNKFLENNVPARKSVQISEDGTGVPTRVRLGPHARRRASKQVVIIQEDSQKTVTEEKSS